MIWGTNKQPKKGLNIELTDLQYEYLHELVMFVETHEKSDQIEWEILNCLGIWGIEGRNEADREVKLWEKVEEYLGTKLASLTYEHNKPHALTAFK